jgi:DNA anti-recombination protein RmuC
MAMRGYQAEAAHYREIANKIRDLALEARSAEIEEDLFELAKRFDRMAELSEKSGTK